LTSAPQVERASLGAPPLGVAALVLAAAFVALAWHASAGPHLFDAGELTAAAAQLGGSHPPGQPLHALIGHAATWIPLGPIAWRIACVSVALGCLAALSAARILVDACARSGLDGPVALALPAVTGLAVLAAPPVLPQLTRPEVYSLALFLVLEGARHLVRWACRDRGASSALRCAALCAGLAIAVHPPHALALLLGGVALALALRRDLFVRPRALGLAALACAAGAAAIAYLPVRGGAGARMWGEPTTASGLLAYLSGSAYRSNLGADERGAWLADALDALLYVLAPVGAIAVLLAAIALGMSIGDRAPRVRLAALAVLAASSLPAAWLQPLARANPDNIAYAAPAVALAVVTAATAIALLARRAGSLALALACALPVVALSASDVRGALPADLPQLETLAFQLIDAPPPRALVVARSDFAGAAWMEARDVDGARPDIALLCEGLATSSWHWRSLAGHPLYDGTPHREGGGRGEAPWVRGAIARAIGSVAVAAESDVALHGRGLVAGPYLVMPTERVAATRLARSFAERTASAPARMIEWTPPGHAGSGHGVVREAAIARARRLRARGDTDLALAALRAAAAPLPPTETAHTETAHTETAHTETAHRRSLRDAPTVVEDPDAIFATEEDAVRELAVTLIAIGATDRAIAILDRQSSRDDRALLQLAWIQAHDGLGDPARAALARYLELHPDRGAETAPLAERLRALP
jgi:hypothetical protein